MNKNQFYDQTLFDRRSNPVRSWSAIFWAAPLVVFAQDIPSAAVEDIRAARGLIEIPLPPNYTLWVAIALGVVLLGVLIWKLASAKHRSPETTAAAKALAALEKCRALLSAESPEPLANAVTETIRVYLDRRFGIAAPRRTTEEFIEDLKSRPNPELAPYGEDLSRFLRSCDAVKFGKAEMAAANRENLIESARRFVEGTRSPSPADQHQPLAA